MKRREFIRIVGAASVVTASAPGYLSAKDSLSSDGVLLEACAFDEPGGWKLDTQFYQQIGGCYLLAHGMGKPVEDAVTKVTIPEAGDWFIFVRTKDWCPGDWEAPGRFNIAVNGKTLGATFGTEKGWSWQAGGKALLKKGPNEVALKDLSGFEGRVDAIYFSRDNKPDLPTTPAEVMGWKDKLSGRSKEKVETLEFDLVVVGGGMTGCAAALAADRQGMKAALIHDRPVFGGNASAEVRVHSLGIKGNYSAIIGQIDTRHWPNGDAAAIRDQVKRDKNMKASDAYLFEGNIAIGLEKKGNAIVSIDARDTRTGIIRRFNAPQFIDCTGDGWLGFWSGAEFRYGRESQKEFGEEWKVYGERWSPVKPDNRVMGTSVLWNSRKGIEKSSFPMPPWAEPVAKGHAASKGEWYWEYSSNDLNQIDDAEAIRDHCFRAIYGSFANHKKSSKAALTELKWVAYVGGRRESRRIMGDYIYSMKDALNGTKFEDAVVEEIRPMDGHYQLIETGKSKLTFLSKAMHFQSNVGLYKGKRIVKGKYYIPFRSLYSKDIANLMIAGRCYSCTHVGLSGPRVMNTCAQMGVATAYAASLCVRHQVNPREVGQKYLAELKKLCGYAVEGSSDQ